MNKNALVLSLKSIIEKGTEFENMGQVQEYINLYNPTKEYINKYKNESDLFRSVYEKLPEMELKEFKNPFRLIYSFIIDKMEFGYMNIGRGTINERFNDSIDAYPERTKYIIDAEAKARQICRLFEDLIGSIEHC